MNSSSTTERKQNSTEPGVDECTKAQAFAIIKDILPNLDDLVVAELLKGNQYDVAKATDAALALSISLENEKGTAIVSTADGDSSTQQLSRPVVQDEQHFNSAGVSGEKRGTSLLLPSKFLVAPRYRLSKDVATSHYTMFTVSFRRVDQKLGITIHEFRSEIAIVEVHCRTPAEPLPAMEAGIKVGDFLTGVNYEYFSPVAEVADVLEILNLSGSFVTLHFTRRYRTEKFNLSNYHSALRLFLEHRVVQKNQVYCVSMHLNRLKDKLLRWDQRWISDRIIHWKLEPNAYRKLITNPNSRFLDMFSVATAIDSAGNTKNVISNQSTLNSRDSSPPPAFNGKSKSEGRRRSLSGLPAYVSADFKTSNYDKIQPLSTTTNNISKSNSSNKRHSTGTVNTRIKANGVNNELTSRTSIDVFKDRQSLSSKMGGKANDNDRNAMKQNHNTAELKDNHPGTAVANLKNTSTMIAESGSAPKKVNDNSLNRTTGDTKTVSVSIGQGPQLQNTTDYRVCVRPALSVRILRAEYESRRDCVIYVVWVLDVMSGVEWIVNRRFSEFLELRESIITFRQNTERFDFPPKRIGVNEPTAIAEERLPQLQRFLRKVSALICVNTLHPSTTRIQLAFQSFLQVEQHGPDIEVEEQRIPFGFSRIAQVFVHNVMQMEVMDKVITGYIDTFTNPQTKEATMNRNWTESDAVELANEVKCFLDHLQNFLFDCLHEDCKELIARYARKARTSGAECNNFDSTRNGKYRINPRAFTQTCIPAPHTNEISEEYLALLEQLNEDELRKLIRSSVRRQVEVEVFIGCSGRFHFVMNQGFAESERKLRSKITQVFDQPQSYFGIPIEHISPSCWSILVYSMKELPRCTLPFDKIAMLLEIAKQIPLLYQEEHPHADSPLGADDILPIFIYIIARAQLPDVLALNQELQSLCDQEDRMSETGYYLATFEASLQHLVEANMSRESIFADDSVGLATYSVRRKSET